MIEINSTQPSQRAIVCAIVPAFKVSTKIVEVVRGLREYVDHTFVVDDACPELSGSFLLEQLNAEEYRFTVVRLPQNQGVGGAVMAGYRAAVDAGFEVLVKVDGDGQMDPKLIPSLIEPILSLEADYTKGNRFFDPESLRDMPLVRLVGNAGLSLVTKLSTGYWQIMDPTNGFTAIHSRLLTWIHLEKIERRYFFETDLLYRLGLIGAVVQDVPMPARYADEVSNLSISKAFFDFGALHLTRMSKRIFYTYFLRSFSLGSVLILFSIPMIIFGVGFGSIEWYKSASTGVVATTGKIMIAAMPILVGIQMLLSFLSLDMSKPTTKPFWLRIQGHERDWGQKVDRNSP
jgi:dolichol-phosphate mannosyltransferase